MGYADDVVFVGGGLGLFRGDFEMMCFYVVVEDFFDVVAYLVVLLLYSFVFGEFGVSVVYVVVFGVFVVFVVGYGVRGIVKGDVVFFLVVVGVR